MIFEGGCYCKAVRYRAEGEPTFRGQCHCRECQYISGGAPNYFMVMPAAGFTYTEGQPRQYRRADLPNGVTREFCGVCGAHLTTRARLDSVVVKVGGMDDPSLYGGPQVVLWTDEAQSFHMIPDGAKAFPRFPQR